MKSKTVYQTANGVYVGETIAHESPLEPGVFHIPAGCIENPPPAIPEGKIAVWRNGWALDEILEEKEAPKPELTLEEMEAQRVASLKGQLAALDYRAIRPLRAIASGVATQADKSYLAALEEEAADIRGIL
jgi:hypothetical protein